MGGPTVGMPDFAAIIRPALASSTIAEVHHAAVLEALRNRAEANVRESSTEPARAEVSAAASVDEVISAIASQLTRPRSAQGVTVFEEEVTAERVESVLNGLCEKWPIPYPWCPAHA